VIAFEEPHSTSGYVLPAGTLLERGFKLIEVTSPDQPIGTEEIGYLFSRDEENTFELVTQDRVVAGAVSNKDYYDLTTELKQKIQDFDRSITVPRQLVSARAGLSTSLQDEVIRLLKALDKTPEGRELLDGLKKTKTFDSLDEDSRAALKKLGEYISLVEGS
jgi:phosphonate transport system substrate-binding protein